jgi:diaminohydroxyphosphoribosylaminopyrimidine deaminase / 5-amino-6-(5-phosphoribosylamino)uracil reductase
MSIKKNKDSYFTKLAFEQAKINLGCTGKNPSVGCVIEKNDSVISSGHTSLYGRPHAEVNALSKNVNFKNATMYVTLEPCSHYGKTPPCTNLIIKKKIKKVYFSINDSDLRSSRKAELIFKNNKIKTNLGNWSKFGKRFYKDYLNNSKKTLPLIDGKIALSKDFCSIAKNKKWITNKHSRKRGHYLRSTYDAILSTSRSINKDNSKLNCRIEGLERKSPAIIIIDRKFKVKNNIDLFNSNKKIYLFTSTKEKIWKKYINKKKIKIIYNKMEQPIDFFNIFLYLKEKGFSRILIESGLTFLNYLTTNKFINNLFIFQSNIKLKSNGSGVLKKNLIKKMIQKNKVKINLFDNNLYKVDFKNV